MLKDFDEFLKHPSEWLRGAGPVSDIVMSSRIRLARNLEKFPFATRATAASQVEVFKVVKDGLMHSVTLKQPLILEIRELDEVDRQFLVERHLVSREHIMHADHKAVAIGQGEVVSIMINEEDHLRIQVMESGFNLDVTWSIINSIDDRLAELLPYAVRRDWGYLTACPTNTGTGMRGSVMLHLPALVMTRQINRVLDAIAKLSFATRGLYGEGTQASGNFFQISNQVSLGQKEEEIIDNIKGVIKQIIEQEAAARNSIFANQRLLLEDRISRSLAELKSAKLISSEETLGLLSIIRLGADLGIVKGLDRSMLNNLFIQIQPAHLQKKEGKQLSAEERDAVRAEFISKKFNI